MVKISTTSGHLDMLRNAIENAVDSQMYPPVEASGGQEQYYIRFHIMNNATEKAVDGQMYPPVQASGGQDQYYIRSPLHCTDKSYSAIGNLTS